MDFRSKFSVTGVRQLTSDASTFLTRAVQYTEEKLGQAEKTEYDANFENLLVRFDKTKQWTERIKAFAENMLQPNPNMRMEEFVYSKLDKRTPDRNNVHEQLAAQMIDAGNDFGPGTAYGSALVKCGTVEQKIGEANKLFITMATMNFLKPINNFLQGDCPTIQKERKTLESKRLDLDASKNKCRKSKTLESRNSAENDLRIAQSEFDRQYEITKLLLDGLISTHANHLRSLQDLVDAQKQYHNTCSKLMDDVQKELFSLDDAPRPSGGIFNRAAQPTAPPVDINDITAGGGESLPFVGKKRARVLYDYDAADSTELSLLADEVIQVVAVPGMTDFVMGERGNQKAKVPLSYLTIL